MIAWIVRFEYALKPRKTRFFQCSLCRHKLSLIVLDLLLVQLGAPELKVLILNLVLELALFV